MFAFKLGLETASVHRYVVRCIEHRITSPQANSECQYHPEIPSHQVMDKFTPMDIAQSSIVILNKNAMYGREAFA